MVGNNVSHSKRRTKRRFYPNLVTKKFYLPEEDAFITLKVATSALRTINKKGININPQRTELYLSLSDIYIVNIASVFIFIYCGNIISPIN